MKAIHPCSLPQSIKEHLLCGKDLMTCLDAAFDQGATSGAGS